MPLKLAVVGAGPSAFYVVSRILQLLPRADDLRIHVYDRLWAPYGLVRYGVAPDHPEVKNCTHKFDAAAADPRVRFFGNVDIVPAAPASAATVPLALPLPALLPHYTHLLIAPGAPVPRTLPHLPHALPALSVVHWYTAHPATPPTPPPLPPHTTHLTLLGLGNVVLDVARLLLTPPAALAARDIPAHALAAWPTALRHVAIVGRRGPRDARFAPKELRELLTLPHARLPPVPPALLDDVPAGAQETRQAARIAQLLRAGSTAAPPATARTLSLDFFRTPVAHDPAARTLVLEDTRSRARSVLRTDAVLAALGFAADPAPWGAWFDPAAGHVRHHAGRVLAPDGARVRNVYVSGWAAHGARGVIAETLLDAKAVAARIVGDHYGGVGAGDNGATAAAAGDEGPAVEAMPRDVDPESVPSAVAAGIAAGAVPGWAEWCRVDAEERRRGAASGKERERMRWEDARAFLHA